MSFFIEFKARLNHEFGHSLDVLVLEKKQKIIQTTYSCIAHQKRVSYKPICFDLVTLTLDSHDSLKIILHENSFQVC
jgi:Holliday junction resolvase-like predicted endonuclease